MAARRVVTGVVLVVLALLGWLLLAPQQVGGPLAIVSTYGTSMLPTYEASDLVVVAKAGEYEVGDVVAYRSDDLGGAVVLHRIVDVDEAGYVTQGDNNDWLDPDRPTAEELMGTARLRVPGAGRLLDLPTPVRAAAVTALAGLALFGGRRTRRRRARRPGPDRPSVQLLPSVRRRRAKRRPRPEGAPVERSRGFTWIGWPLQTALVAVAVLVLALILTVIAFTRPSTGPGERTYTHRGTFTYAADAPSGAVYPTGELTTGDPIFSRLVDEVEVAFTYEFIAPGSTVEPTGQLWLVITDGSGWSTRTSLGAAQVAEEGTLRLEGTLDIPRARRSIAEVREQTGIEGGGGTLTVVAEVEVAGSIAGDPVSDRFSPELALELGDHRLTVEGADAPTDPEVTDPEVGATRGDDPAADVETDRGIVRSQEGAVTLPDAEAARLEFAGRGLDVATARIVALVALGVALTALAVAVTAAARQGDLDEATRIQLRHGRRIVEVAALELPAGFGIVDVRDVATLVTLADRTDRPILHHRSASADTFLVEGDATVYRYRVEVVRSDASSDDQASG